jgi:exocyst complex component 8
LRNSSFFVLTPFLNFRKLEFFVEYETKKLAAINIRDLDGVKNAIKIMTSDDSKIFQCINSAAKLEWIEKLDSAIKPMPSVKHKKGPAPAKPVQKQISTSSELPSPQYEHVMEKLAPDWLVSAPEEIHAEIAQRHFEDSLALLQKCEDYLERDKTCQNAAEIANKVRRFSHFANVHHFDEWTHFFR